MVRYGFNIRTRTGQRVDNILILAASLTDAERRLRQMYIQCQILERRGPQLARRGAHQPAGLLLIAAEGRRPSRHDGRLGGGLWLGRV